MVFLRPFPRCSKQYSYKVNTAKIEFSKMLVRGILLILEMQGESGSHYVYRYFYKDP
jgi:hypothetical protein